jgi:glycosyltransferase involved in cell wall biosynthesis
MKKDKLNIAHLHWGFPPIIGGVETHLTIILPEMRKLDHNISLLTGTAEGARVREKYRGVKVFRAPIMDLNWLFKRGLVGIQDEVSRVFSNFLNENNPDIIHVHNMHYFSKIHAEILGDLAKQRKIPLILTAHNTWDDLLFLELTHNIDWTHIIAVSHFIKKEIVGIGMDDTKITVIHHGIDQNKFNPKTSTKKILKRFSQLKDKKVIFHPARIGLAKGCDTSIKAINFVKEQYPNVILVLAGSKNIIDWGTTQQKDIAYLVSLIKHFQLRENCLIDAYSLEEMQELYAVSDICVYPSSSSEPFGLTMLEAMATAKPMIITNAGGMPEVIQDGINGYVIAVRDFELLSAKIITLLGNKKLRNRFGYTGRQMIAIY